MTFWDFFFQGECSAVMADQVEGESIDLVVTSPPYGEVFDNSDHYCNEYDFAAVAEQLWRVLKPGGQVCWNEQDKEGSGDSSGLSFEHCLAFKAIGFKLVKVIIYSKFAQPRRGDVRLYQTSHEYVFELAKGFPATVHQIEDRPNRTYGRPADSHTHRNKNNKKQQQWCKPPKEFGARGTVWVYDTSGGASYEWCDKELLNDFPAPMPEKLAGDLILSFSNPEEVVLDPFGGAGTTAKMARKYNRHFVYIDLLPDNLRIAKQRVAKYHNKLPLTNEVKPSAT